MESRRITLALAAVMLLIGGFSLCGSESAIASEGESTPIILYDGASGSLSCVGNGGVLFPQADELVPGDAVIQDVEVRACNLSEPVVLEMSVEASAGSSVALGEAVRIDAQYGDNPVVSQSLSAWGEGADIAELRQDGQARMSIALVLPPSLGNDVSGTQAELLWMLAVRDGDGHKAVMAENTLFPRTSDSILSAALAAVFGIAASALGVCGIVLSRRRKARMPRKRRRDNAAP